MARDSAWWSIRSQAPSSGAAIHGALPNDWHNAEVLQQALQQVLAQAIPSISSWPRRWTRPTTWSTCRRGTADPAAAAGRQRRGGRAVVEVVEPEGPVSG